MVSTLHFLIYWQCIQVSDVKQHGIPLNPDLAGNILRYEIHH
jgi:hypothetical protein